MNKNRAVLAALLAAIVGALTATVAWADGPGPTTTIAPLVCRDDQGGTIVKKEPPCPTPGTTPRPTPKPTPPGTLATPTPVPVEPHFTG